MNASHMFKTHTYLTNDKIIDKAKHVEGWQLTLFSDYKEQDNRNWSILEYLTAMIPHVIAQSSECTQPW